MNPIPVRLLHVDDDRIQQAVVARCLQKMTEYQFSIQTATSEEEAMRHFGEAGAVDFVILDYQLGEGDGLSCLRRMREIDPFIPIVAVSGVASTEIAAHLIEEGADDYLCKHVLNFGQILCQSVRNAMTRAKAFRKRFAAAK